MKTYCTRRHCGLRFEITTSGSGRDVGSCPGCDRNARGLCRDCPKSIDRRRMRCEPCARRVALAKHRTRGRHYRAVSPEKERASKAKYYARPEIKARHRVKEAARRSSRPRTELDRAYMRAMMALYRSDPTYRARQNRRRRHLRRTQRRVA